jgi:thiosulfate/3-mercaptopyruvate sulfurtransferase
MHRLLAFLAIAAAAFSAAASAQSSARDHLVVTPAWLADHLKDPNLVLLHVGQKKTYDAGHLPGARFITMDNVSAPMDHSNMKPGELMTEMPVIGAMRDTLAAFGISNQSQIVVYFSDGNISPATRVVYALNWAGLGGRTVMLQGGIDAWKRDGHQLTTDVAQPKPGQLAALTAQPLIVDAAFVQTKARTPGFALVDGRPQAAYDGVPPSNANGNGNPLGHIPGAASVPYLSAYDEAGNLRPAEELDAIFARAGVKPGDTVIGYCWVGQYATAMLFAARAAGHPVLLYDGSIDDWTNRKLPLETVKK